MQPDRITLSAAAYELGEDARHFSELPRFKEKVAAFGMPDDPAMWGLGEFRATRRSKVELALSSARQTLQRSGLAAGDVDALMVCSVLMPSSISDQVAFTDALCGGLDMAATPVYGLTLNRCASLLSGVQMARSLVLSGEYRHILVLGVDIAASDEDRFDRFAIFSDGAASCIVSSALAAGFEIEKSVWKGATLRTAQAFDFDGGLARSVTERLDISGGADAVAQVFHDNLFTPIVTMREAMAGFSSEQLYLANIERFGHCFSCDPLINLCDSEHAAPSAPGASLLLACSTPGLRVALLLRTSLAL